MWVTSCTLNLDSLSRNFNHEIRQQFGYHNSPIGEGRSAARFL